MKTLGFSLLCISSFVKTELRSNISEIKLSWHGPEDIDPVYEPLLGEYVFSKTKDVFTSKISKPFVIKHTDESGTNWRLDLDNDQGYLLFSIYSGGGSINRNRVMLVNDGNYSAVPQITFDFIFTNLTTDRVILRPIPPPPSIGDSEPIPEYRRCLEEDVESCIQVELNIEVLKFGALIELPDGTQIELSERNETFAVFKNSGNTIEALFVWSVSGDEHVAGHVNVEGASFILEGCGTQCYLWIKQSRSSSVESQDFEEEREPRNINSYYPKTEEYYYKLGIRDTTTTKYISLMIWYTKQFFNKFDSKESMDNYIRREILQTNQGYINSNVPMRVSEIGVKEHPTLQNEIFDATKMLPAFKSSMCSQELLNCADASILYVSNSSFWGYASYNSKRSCDNFGIVKYGHPRTLAHELGHNFGCDHNRLNATKGVPPLPGKYNFGYLIQPRGQGKLDGYHTIMAYFNNHYMNQVNYWSNPAIILPDTGTPTGVRGRNNNAKVLTENRFGFGNCGNGDLSDGRCFPCCDSVKVDSFEHRYSNYLAGTYDRYHNTPEANGRAVYQHRDKRSYCMWYSKDWKIWVIGSCGRVGIGNAFIWGAERTERNCMVGISSWQVESTTNLMTLTFECVDCCQNVELVSTNSDILDSWYGKNLLGTYNYQKYHADRYVYKMPNRPYCLFYERRQWMVTTCAAIGQNRAALKTQSDTNNRMCVTSADDWASWTNNKWVKDSTMHVKCNDKK